MQWKGQKEDYFKIHKDLRQGHHIFSYVFLLCMDKLTHMIKDVVEDDMWKCLRARRRGPKFTHLMFADDLLLFGRAFDEQIGVVKSTLERFWSKDNLQKV